MRLAFGVVRPYAPDFFLARCIIVINALAIFISRQNPWTHNDALLSFLPPKACAVRRVCVTGLLTATMVRKLDLQCNQDTTILGCSPRFNVTWMLTHRLQCCTNINITLRQYLVFAGPSLSVWYSYPCNCEYSGRLASRDLMYSYTCNSVRRWWLNILKPLSPSKQHRLIECCFIVGPASQAVAQQ